MLHELIHFNYATILIVVFLIIFLLSNASFEKRTIRLFMTAIAMGVVLVLVDSIESYTETWSEPSNLRILMSAIGYTLRPMSVLCVLLIIIRGRKINKVLFFGPVIINAIVSFSAFFCDWAYSYDENNEFVRGPLGITAYITSAIYLIILCILTVQYIRKKSYYEGMIVFVITATSIMSILLEVAFAFDGFINASIAVSVTFYYMYYLVINFKNDPLTQTLNRHYFKIDMERNEEDIHAVINIDLNDLKVINDTKGHEYGDKALVEVSDCMRRHLPRKCKLYRVGGDEFCILSFNGNSKKCNEYSMEKIIDDIRKELKNSGYVCAMGLAIRKNNESIEELLKRADDIMYENKAMLKSKI